MAYLYNERQKCMVRYLLEFKFTKRGTYKLTNKRLKVLEEVVRHRARLLLE